MLLGRVPRPRRGYWRHAAAATWKFDRDRRAPQVRAPEGRVALLYMGYSSNGTWGGIGVAYAAGPLGPFVRSGPTPAIPTESFPEWARQAVHEHDCVRLDNGTYVLARARAGDGGRRGVAAASRRCRGVAAARRRRRGSSLRSGSRRGDDAATARVVREVGKSSRQRRGGGDADRPRGLGRSRGDAAATTRIVGLRWIRRPRRPGRPRRVRGPGPLALPRRSDPAAPDKKSISRSRRERVLGRRAPAAAELVQRRRRP